MVVLIASPVEDGERDDAHDPRWVNRNIHGSSHENRPLEDERKRRGIEPTRTSFNANALYAQEAVLRDARQGLRPN